MTKALLTLCFLASAFGAEYAQKGTNIVGYPLDTSMPASQSYFIYWDGTLSSNRVRSINVTNALSVTQLETSSGKNIITSDEIDSISELETLLGVNVILNTEIDTSAELAAILTDETGIAGGGVLVFNQSPTIVTPTIASFANATHNHQNSAGGGQLAEAALSLTDNTTANVSTSAHGFAPKLPNDATKYLDGTGNYSVPPGSGGTGSTLTNATLKGITTRDDQQDWLITDLTSSTAVTVKWTNATQYLPLATNATVTFSGSPTSTTRGRPLLLEVTNTGSFTLTWPTSVVWRTANTLPATKTTKFYLWWDRTNIVAEMDTAQIDATQIGDGSMSNTRFTQLAGHRTRTIPALQFPRVVDGAGCTYVNTNDFTANTFMVPRFSGTAATNANFCRFSFFVPDDLDTNYNITLDIGVRLTGGDTGGHIYHIGVADVAPSATVTATAGNFVVMTLSGDASGASDDFESVTGVTATGWKDVLIPNHFMVVEIRRAGASDASTVASDLLQCNVRYTSTQL